MQPTKYRMRLVKNMGIPLLAFILGVFIANTKFLSKTLSVSPNLIPLNSTEGKQLLLISKARQDYLPLSANFVTQKNQAYCGVASIVMVLNALAIPAPKVLELGNSHAFTQDNVFNQQMRQVQTPFMTSLKGMTLEQLSQFLKSYPVKVEVHYASNMPLDKFRLIAAKNLQESNNFILVNYLRSSIGQQRWGHISPIAAYDYKTDRFLILDVSRNKYPPVWVKASSLWQAMATRDAESDKMRGLVLVSTR